jgi:predicted DsbA family dithiol-disulfide isomerase
VSNTYPGWSGTPGSETHPLQSSMLFNVKEELPGGKVDPYFGKNTFPSKEYQETWQDLANPMHEAALRVLRGCDLIVEEGMAKNGQDWTNTGRSLHRLGLEGPALAGRFICYDSGFTREDKLLDGAEAKRAAEPQTPKQVGHAGDGLASMRTHQTPVKSSGNHSVNGASFGKAALEEQVHELERQLAVLKAEIASMEGSSAPGAEKNEDAGDYWLPWHIDSNFVTILHKEMYASESTTEFLPEPEGSGLFAMTPDGEVQKVITRDDAVLLQMGAFGQIYSGGELNACRHAVVSVRPPGVARFNFCNFWYVPWNTVCDTPDGREEQAVSKGWNAMMDESYLNITMKQSFVAFRQFMTSPEARMQFADSVRFLELAEFLPLPERGAAQAAPGSTQVVVDALTDVRCPFSFISTLNLETALREKNLDKDVIIRYRPVFLNPNVPKEGESLDDYLLRDHGYSKEYAHSEDYPLRKMGLAAGTTLNPNRRVVNTFDAFMLIDAAEEHGKTREVVSALNRRYFEEAEDISDWKVLTAAAVEGGLPEAKVSGWLDDDERRARVQSTYLELADRIGEVPHFLLRERVSGNGLEVGGNRSVEEWGDVLDQVLERASFVGKDVPGLDGEPVQLLEANPTSPISMALAAQHQWTPTEWPYTAQDFSRMDESSDVGMYLQPRLVNHLDESSLLRLKEAYRRIFSQASPGFSVLDLCSSWVSHFPEELMQGARVAVHGLNSAELEANVQATERHMQNLNEDPRLPWGDSSFDFVTMALSVQYLTDPRAVFSEMHRVLRPGGVAVIAHSHRCFIEKAVKVFADATYDGEGHTHHICRYFQHSPVGGWDHLATADVSPRHGDPVWLVTAVKAK